MEKKLLIVASMFGRDGTSRFLTYLANSLSDQNIKIKMLFFRDVENDLLKKICDKVDIECLGIKKNLWIHFFPILLNIVKYRPDFCFFGFHQLLWMSFLKPFLHLFGIKLYFRDTIIPTLFHKGESNLKRYISRKAYRQFDYIIVQSKDMRDDLVNNWGCFPSKMVLINNPVDVLAIRNSIGECPEELKDKKLFTFISAGRLTYQKGYDIIIERMAEIKSKLDFQLFILGSGDLYDNLNSLIRDKGLEDKIKLLGYKTNVASYIHYADALLLSSRYEGFPNIVLETNALGKPVFTNLCPGGINEIVQNGENGVVCDFENPDDFKSGLDLFLKTYFNGDRIKYLTVSRYDIKNIMQYYKRAFS